MTELLSTLTSALQAAPALALLAALGLGVASVVLSPCHLPTVNGRWRRRLPRRDVEMCDDGMGSG